jgi:hypothetical protein
MGPLMLTLSTDPALRLQAQLLWTERHPEGRVGHALDMADVLLRLAGAAPGIGPRLLVFDTDCCTPLGAFVHQVRRLAPALDLLALGGDQGAAVQGLRIWSRSAWPMALQRWLQPHPPP